MARFFNTSTASDDELMRRSQADDVAAFEQLYDRYGALALRVARSVCRDTAHAEEAVQEGFLSIWRNRATYCPGTGTFKSWSMRIVRNNAIDSTRHEAAAKRRLLADAWGTAPDAFSRSPQTEVIAREERAALHASLRRLPNAQAEVITLAFYGDLTRVEIARQLSLPLGTVKGRMRLGLEKLRGQVRHAG